MKKICFFLRTFFYSMIFFLFFLFSFVFYIWQKGKEFSDKVYPNVYVDGIDFSRKREEDVKKYFEKKNNQLKKVIIILSYQNNEWATYSAEIINLKYDDETLIKQIFLIGRSQNLERRVYQKILSFLNLYNFRFQANLTFNLKLIEEYLSYLEEKYNKKPINALFEVKNNRVTAFRIEELGLRIKTDETLEEVKEKIYSLKKSFREKINIIIEDQPVNPEISLSSINNFGIVEKIGEGKSNFSGSIVERIHNIKLASSKFHGILIPKDEIFSFNKTIGDISSNTGYKPAYIIKNGRTVLGDGGGICQVSTTLFRAAIKTGLPIIERVGHAYRVSYYENDSKPGMDATIFAPSVDLKFKNDTPAHILIQAHIDEKNNILTFDFFGKKDNRQVEISDITVWDVLPPPAPIYQDDPSLKKGIIKQVDWPAWGAKAKFYYKVKKEEKVIFDQEFITSYRPWRAVFLVGTAE